MNKFIKVIHHKSSGSSLYFTSKDQNILGLCNIFSTMGDWKLVTKFLEYLVRGKSSQNISNPIWRADVGDIVEVHIELISDKKYLCLYFLKSDAKISDDVSEQGNEKILLGTIDLHKAIVHTEKYIDEYNKFLNNQELYEIKLIKNGAKILDYNMYRDEINKGHTEHYDAAIRESTNGVIVVFTEEEKQQLEKLAG